MKRFFLELIVIVGLSLVIGLSVNYLSSSGLPLLESYQPPQKEQKEEIFIQEIDAEFLMSMIEGDMAVVFDARKRSEYEMGHIPGAVSFSLYEFDERLGQLQDLLNSGKTIITYCVDPSCHDSHLLATKLHELGFHDLLIYKDGIEGWTALGYPTETPEGAEIGGGGE
jgi:rhodanese-related sulfurtransferase